MFNTFLSLLETKTFFITLTILPLIAGTALPYIYNRLELMQAFYNPEQVNKKDFDLKKQQQFIKRYNNCIERNHLEIIDNEYIRKRVNKQRT